MIHYYPNDHFDFIHCSINEFDYSNLDQAIYKCGRRHAGLDAGKVIECAKGNIGRDLLMKSGRRTKSVNLNHVPWIVVDGKHNNKIQDKTEYNLMRFLCLYYDLCV